jgi:hypothetical protein
MGSSYLPIKLGKVWGRLRCRSLHRSSSVHHGYTPFFKAARKKTQVFPKKSTGR